MDTATALSAIATHGYVVIPDAISAAQIATIREQLSPWMRGERMGRNDFEGLASERVYALLAKSPAVAELVEHPQILDIVDQLLPANYLLSAALAINIHPGETPQGFHMDDSGNKVQRKPRPMLGVSTIWALDDFTADNGATQVCPGSHLWEHDRTPTEADALSVVMSAGSVVVFGGNVYHRGGANTSTGTRLGITPQYCAPWLRQIENMVLAVPPERAAQYSDRIQSMLGYNVIDPGFMGYVDGMHPKRLIDPDYRGRKAKGTGTISPQSAP